MNSHYYFQLDFHPTHCYIIPMEEQDNLNPESTHKNAKTKKYRYPFAAVKNDPSNRYFYKQMQEKQELILVCYKSTITTTIENIFQYGFKISSREKKLLPKHQILYCYKPDAAVGVEKHLQLDENVAAMGLGVEVKPAERFQVDEELLRKCCQENRKITVTLRNGHKFTGTVHRYGIFSIRLQLDRNTRIIVMCPAMYAVEYED